MDGGAAGADWARAELGGFRAWPGVSEAEQRAPVRGLFQDCVKRACSGLRSSHSRERFTCGLLVHRRPVDAGVSLQSGVGVWLCRRRVASRLASRLASVSLSVRRVRLKPPPPSPHLPLACCKVRVPWPARRRMLHARSESVPEDCLRSPAPDVLASPITLSGGVRCLDVSDEVPIVAVALQRMGSVSSFNALPPHTASSPGPAARTARSRGRGECQWVAPTTHPPASLRRLYILDAEITRHASTTGHASRSGCFKEQAAAQGFAHYDQGEAMVLLASANEGRCVRGCG